MSLSRRIVIEIARRRASALWCPERKKELSERVVPVSEHKLEVSSSYTTNSYMQISCAAPSPSSKKNKKLTWQKQVVGM